MILFLLCMLTAKATPADTVGTHRHLREVSITQTSRRVLRTTGDGSVKIHGSGLGETPGIGGAPDAIALVRALPATATPNDLQAGISIRGGASGDNHFSSDGIRVVNPMHMLGLYSAYNPSYYKEYRFRSGRIPATELSATAGVLDASTNSNDSIFTGQVSVGAVESHLGLSVPMAKRRVTVTAGARKSYLGLLFPDILTLGSSRLTYGFYDANFGAVFRSGRAGTFSANLFYSSDGMDVSNKKAGTKDGEFGWSNFAAGVSWVRGHQEARLSLTDYSNSFVLNEGSITLNLPSTFRQYTAQYRDLLGSHWEIESDLSRRGTAGQQRESLKRNSWEWNIGVSYLSNIRKLRAQTGLRLGTYFTSGYSKVLPMPRLDFSVDVAPAFRPFVSYNLLMQCDRQIEQTQGGLPADFWICADAVLPPQTTHSFAAGASGLIPGVFIRYVIEGYFRRSANVGEFLGSLTDLTNPFYSPLDNVALGNSVSHGVSVTLYRQFGALRGRVGYNLGKSKTHIPQVGNGYFPSSHDRLHDLNVSLTCEPLRGLALTAIYVHATGLPYTRAKYGYIIGGNLICEYFPRNSSRLPSYNRLDFSARYSFGKGHLRHSVALSAYNAACCRNVLFVYTAYSLDQGIEQRQSVMKAVIPSISYTFDF